MSVDLNHLSEADVIPPPAAAPPASPAADTGPVISYEPLLHGESAYDRTTSMLMSLVIGAALIVGFLSLIYFTQNAYAGRVVHQLDLVEVYGNGPGGSPDGSAGATEAVDVPAAEAGDTASNNTAEDTSIYEQPSIQETPSVALDAMAPDANSDLGEGTEMGPVATGPTSSVAGGKRATKAGTGGQGIGTGGGGGNGYSRENRWLIVYPPGQPETEYAKQLDAFGVELASWTTGNSLKVAANFSGKPVVRNLLVAKYNAEKKLGFTFDSAGRRAGDLAMLKLAGIDPGNNPIIQIYPKVIEEKLAVLENAYKGLTPAQIRQTRFRVVSAGSGWDFEVVSQVPIK